MRVLWCITGAGYMLRECVDFLKKIDANNAISIAMSEAGYEVLNMYGLYGEIGERENVLEKEQGSSFIFSGKVNGENFDLVVVAPCTANTVAKIACGISDTLITNIVAQALKHGVRVCILPTDFEESQMIEIPKRNEDGVLVSGKEVEIKCRGIDLKNLDRLRKTRGIVVIEKPEEIQKL